MKVSKFALMMAFFTGAPFAPLGFDVINSIEREDGSNNSYNVTGITFSGEDKTCHVRAS